MHLDFLVDDLQAAEAFASTCGAARFDFQPNADHCIVMRDPAGHPFCLTMWEDVAVKTGPSGEVAGLRSSLAPRSARAWSFASPSTRSKEPRRERTA